MDVRRARPGAAQRMAVRPADVEASAGRVWCYLPRRGGVCDNALAAADFAALLDFELDNVFAAADAALRPVCRVFFAISCFTSPRAYLLAGTRRWCHADGDPHTTPRLVPHGRPACRPGVRHFRATQLSRPTSGKHEGPTPPARHAQRMGERTESLRHLRAHFSGGSTACRTTSRSPA